MGIKSYIKKVRENYIIWQVEKMEKKFPTFQEGNICRQKFRFTGRVQHVGFRLETKVLAIKLGLTGKAVNLKDGSVMVEVQGQVEKIDYLLGCLYKIKRFKILNCEAEEMEVKHSEYEFILK